MGVIGDAGGGIGVAGPHLSLVQDGENPIAAMLAAPRLDGGVDFRDAASAAVVVGQLGGPRRSADSGRLNAAVGSAQGTRAK